MNRKLIFVLAAVVWAAIALPAASAMMAGGHAKPLKPLTPAQLQSKQVTPSERQAAAKRAAAKGVAPLT